MLKLTNAAAQAIAAHAEATYPDECVGLLLGRLEGSHKHAVAIQRAENSWQGQVALGESDDPQSRRDRFYLDPRDYLRAERAARQQGLDIVGCYHSHPDHPPQPSERDRVGAQGVGGGEMFSFVIQNVAAGTAGTLASWLLLKAGDEHRFAAETLQLVDEDYIGERKQ